jgi:hypothetical protein
LKNVLAHPVPSKRESKILLLAGNKEGLKFFQIDLRRRCATELESSEKLEHGADDDRRQPSIDPSVGNKSDSGPVIPNRELTNAIVVDCEAWRIWLRPLQSATGASLEDRVQKEWRFS